ncbi:mannose-1-phosphate guanylyltransferase/mannose-6-phosphate isomerase [Amorphus orientalis]|uniref:mannose-1-phosphate guanylyltransferase n=1 Tax=Amorphus orientalis TaxID=649198 RepID=A0AAE3VQD2_9HYPH|nr:mannose-1-phosphate guanylyltransferase/mannose-6-phosphate isomerase [Amorphus orientalis]MDQ0316207.1 mannose-1-phosphate guanylyltransferase/mannose-6-phosphate isomerase [Amorphus orientalis]
MVVPVILSGGSGTRLWPLSRADLPKQLAPLFGEESLFQHTVRRVTGTPLYETPMVLASADGRFLIREQLQDLGLDGKIVLEPTRRDTLAAITAAAVIAYRDNPGAVILIMPSDHLIADVEAFAESAATAARIAETGGIVTLGVKPTHPATGYGYIAPGEPGPDGSFKVARFLEKPSAEAAITLIDEGCLWNAGMFCFRAESLLDEVRRLEPETLAAIEASVDEAQDDVGFVLLGPSFENARSISFDYAVMERTDASFVVPVDFSWSDVGDWKAFWEATDHGEDGVTTTGDVVALESRNSIIRSGGRLICAVGVENLAIVETPDAVLVADMQQSQKVKDLVGTLASLGRSEAAEHARVYRPWGWYQTMDIGDRFRVKRIAVKPGAKLSLQKHFHRAEHWVVVRGTAEITVGDDTRILRENESIFIPMGEVHRLANPGKIGVEIIEVQTGAYLEEDDIVRIQDDFGRQ